MLWILIFGLFVVAAVAVIALPLFAGQETWEVPGQQELLERLLAEKARALRTLKDLESERRAELMDDDAYEAARTEYIAEAVALNRRIADLTGADPSRLQEAGLET